MNPGDHALPCPACGYDLRAASSNLCPECGKPFERGRLLDSNIPWARPDVGWFWAYFATLWIITFRGQALLSEHQKFHSKREARGFHWITVALFAFGLITTMATLNAHLKRQGFSDWGAFTLIKRIPFFTQRDGLLVPWLAGVAFPPLLPVLILWFGLIIVRLPFHIVRAERHSSISAEKIRCLACYASAPLFWSVLGGGIALVMWQVEWSILEGPDASEAEQLTLVFAGIASAGLYAMLYRALWWRALLREEVFLSTLTGLGRAIGELLLAAFVILVLIPWSIGFVRIVIDSFR